MPTIAASARDIHWLRDGYKISRCTSARKNSKKNLNSAYENISI